MSATTVAAPISARAWATMRQFAVALAVIVLLATAFVVGRTTAHSTVTRVPVITPASSSVTGHDSYIPRCSVGRPC